RPPSTADEGGSSCKPSSPSPSPWTCPTVRTWAACTWPADRPDRGPQPPARRARGRHRGRVRDAGRERGARVTPADRPRPGPIRPGHRVVPSSTRRLPCLRRDDPQTEPPHTVGAARKAVTRPAEATRTDAALSGLTL